MKDLIAEAKRKYPLGTRFYPINTKIEAVITTADFRVVDGNNLGEYEFNTPLEITDELSAVLTTRGFYHTVYSKKYGWAKILTLSINQIETIDTLIDSIILND